MRKKYKLLFVDALFSTLLSCTILFFLSFIFFNLTFFDPLKKALTDFDFLDVYYAENLNDMSQIESDIVIINIEDKNRQELAILIQSVIDENPSVIGLDAIFKDRKDAFSDSLLRKTLYNNKIVTAYKYEDFDSLNNHYYFRSTNASGYVNFNFDEKTSVIREFIGIYKVDNTSHLSFSASVAKKYLGSRWNELEFEKKLDDLQTIKFHGDYESFLTFGFEEFMESSNKSIIKDKIVILGYLGTPLGNPYDIEDKHFTPMNEVTAGKSIPDMYGAVIHANIVRMVIKNDFFYRLSNIWIGILALLTMFFCTLYYIVIDDKYKISYKTRKSVFLFLVTVILIWLMYWFFKQGLIINCFPIILAAGLAGGYYKYYKHLIGYVKTKRKWKTYI